MASQENTEFHNIDQSLAVLGLAATFLSVCSNGLIILMRSGLDVAIRSHIFSVSFIMTVVFSIFCIPRKFRYRIYKNKVYLLLLGVSFLVLSPILSYFFGSIIQYFYWLIGAAAFTFSTRFLVRIPFWQIFGLLIITSILSVHIFGQSQFPAIYFHEGASVGLGRGYDFFYNTLANMSSTLGSATLAVDNTHFASYHVGVTFWFAMIARATGDASTLTSPIGLMGTLVPLLYWFLCVSSLSLCKTLSNRPFYLFCLASALILIGDHFSPSLKENSIVMASQTLSLVLFLPAISTAILVSRLSTNSTILLYSLLTGIIFGSAMLFSKISTGLIYFVLFVLVFPRKREHYILFSISVICFLSLLAFFGINFSPSGFQGSGSQLLSSYAMLATPGQYLLYFFPAIIFLLFHYQLKLRSENYPKITLSIDTRPNQFSRAIKGLFEASILRGATVSELVFGGIILSVLAGLVLRIGHNTVYFFVTLTWFSYLLILSSQIITHWNPFRTKSVRNVLIPILLIPILSIMILADFVERRNQLWKYQDELAHRVGVNKMLSSKSLLKNGTFVLPEFANALEKSSWKPMINFIKNNSLVSTAIHIPNSNREFWDLLAVSNPYRCLTLHTFFQSQTGRPILVGYDSKYQKEMFEELNVWFNLQCPENAPSLLGQEYSDIELCDFAKDQGIGEILIIPSKNTKAVRHLSCLSQS